MWFKPRPPTLARMPSTRAQPLNPRAPKAPAGAAVPSSALVSALFLAEEEAQTRARVELAGAFHESSYELRSGLDVTESEWPEGVTTPEAPDKDASGSAARIPPKG